MLLLLLRLVVLTKFYNNTVNTTLAQVSVVIPQDQGFPTWGPRVRYGGPWSNMENLTLN